MVTFQHPEVLTRVIQVQGTLRCLAPVLQHTDFQNLKYFLPSFFSSKKPSTSPNGLFFAPGEWFSADETIKKTSFFRVFGKDSYF
jgi:hypothetical protein